MRFIGRTVYVALQHAIQGSARGFEALFHLLEYELRLPRERNAPYLARQRIERRQPRHVNGFTRHDYRINRTLAAAFEIGRNRLDPYRCAFILASNRRAFLRKWHNCRAPTVRRMPNCLRLMYLRMRNRIKDGRGRKSCRSCRSGGRHRARNDAGGPHGRPVVDGHRACLLRQYLPFDCERPPEQARCRAAPCRHAQAPFQLLPHRGAAGRKHVGEHQACCRHRSPRPPQPTLGSRPSAPVCPQLLRSSGRQGRRRYYRCAGDDGAHRAHRRRRRGHVLGRAFPLYVRRRSDVAAAPAILPAVPRLDRTPLSPERDWSALQFCGVFCSLDGSSAYRAAAR